MIILSSTISICGCAEGKTLIFARAYALIKPKKIKKIIVLSVCKVL